MNYLQVGLLLVPHGEKTVQNKISSKKSPSHPEIEVDYNFLNSEEHWELAQTVYRNFLLGLGFDGGNFEIRHYDNHR